MWKEKYTNEESIVYLYKKCFYSRLLDFDSPDEFCNKNNDVFITPDGNAKVCRMKKDKIEIITFDMVSNTYRVLGEVVGNAFKDGLKLKD